MMRQTPTVNQSIWVDFLVEFEARRFKAILGRARLYYPPQYEQIESETIDLIFQAGMRVMHVKKYQGARKWYPVDGAGQTHQSTPHSLRKANETSSSTSSGSVPDETVDLARKSLRTNGRNGDSKMEANTSSSPRYDFENRTDLPFRSSSRKAIAKENHKDVVHSVTAEDGTDTDTDRASEDPNPSRQLIPTMENNKLLGGKHIIDTIRRLQEGVEILSFALASKKPDLRHL